MRVTRGVPRRLAERSGVKAAGWGVDEVPAKLKDDLNPFTGPIYDNKGKLRLPGAASYDLRGDLPFGDWFVKGVITS